MKAKIKSTGEIVEVFHYGKHHFLEYIGEKTGRLFLAEKLDLLDNGLDYWARLEHQYAGMFLQAQISYGEQEDLNAEEMVEDAMVYAHTLVEKLKEKEERK